MTIVRYLHDKQPDVGYRRTMLEIASGNQKMDEKGAKNYKNGQKLHLEIKKEMKKVQENIRWARNCT